MRKKSRLTCLAIAMASSLLGMSGVALAANEAMIEQGRQYFNMFCMACHQADAIGKPGMAPSHANPELLSIASDEFFITTISNGRAGTSMIPFSFLGPQKIKEIVAYLRSNATLSDRSEEVNAQPDAHGDPRLGEQWFKNICSNCHGVKGDGYIAGGTGTAIGKPGFLNNVSDGFIRTTIKEGRSNTRMLGFQGATGLANLTNSEIDDIIVYLRTSSQ